MNAISTVRLVVISIALGLTAACGGDRAKGAAEVAEAFLIAMEEGNFEKAKEYASAESQEAVEGMASMAHRNDDAKAHEGAEIKVGKVAVAEDGNSAAVTYTSNGTLMELEMVKENGEWKVVFRKDRYPQGHSSNASMQEGVEETVTDGPKELTPHQARVISVRELVAAASRNFDGVHSGNVIVFKEAIGVTEEYGGSNVVLELAEGSKADVLQKWQTYDALINEALPDWYGRNPYPNTGTLDGDRDYYWEWSGCAPKREFPFVTGITVSLIRAYDRQFKLRLRIKKWGGSSCNTPNDKTDGQFYSFADLRKGIPKAHVIAPVSPDNTHQHSEFEIFWKDFRRAVATDDIDGVIAMSAFPFPSDAHSGKLSRAEFREHYGQIIGKFRDDILADTWESEGGSLWILWDRNNFDGWLGFDTVHGIYKLKYFTLSSGD